MTMDMLELRSIDKIYRSRGKSAVHAVRSLDMAVEKGEIVALLGSSGCGKTSNSAHDRGLRERHVRLYCVGWAADRRAAAGTA